MSTQVTFRTGMAAAAGDTQVLQTARTRRRRLAWNLILVADIGIAAWGAMAAGLPDFLPGPGGTPILIAGYEGFSRGSWSELAPGTAGYIKLLFRMYGVFNAAFGLMAIFIATTAFRRGERWAWWALLLGNTTTFIAAMIYDKTVHAIGPFELTEYLGLAVIYAALAMTAPIPARAARPSGGG